MTTTSEAATEAMAELREHWMRAMLPRLWSIREHRAGWDSYEAGWRAALAWAAKEKNGE